MRYGTHKHRVAAAACAVLSGLSLSAGALAHAADDAGVVPWLGMGPHAAELESQGDTAAANLNSAEEKNPSPAGTNVACTPAPGENPVVLIHGFNSNAVNPFGKLGPELARAGKCVYAFTYGAFAPQGSEEGGSATGVYGMAPMKDSIQEVKQKIDLIKQQTGATEVDLVSHSEGGAIVTGYTKEVGGQGVGTVVSVAGALRGTDMYGVAMLNRELEDLGSSVQPVANALGVAAGPELLTNSDYYKQLLATPLEVEGVHYVSVATHWDETVRPNSNSQFVTGDYENYILQDGCAVDHSNHSGILYSPRGIALIKRGLGIDAPLTCEPRNSQGDAIEEGTLSAEASQAVSSQGPLASSDNINANTTAITE